MLSTGGNYKIKKISKRIFIILLLTFTLSELVLANNGGDVVNFYSNRHYDTDQELLDLFTEETRIKVNVLKGDSDQLIERIAREGEDTARDWAKGVVENMARKPKSNDRAQTTAVAAGIGDIAIMNTYYIGKMLNSSNPEEVKVAEQVSVFFPNQRTAGTHINVSGIGLTKHAKNQKNAVKLMEFLTGKVAQELFAEANYKYPVNPAVEPSELLKSWGDFKPQNINLTLLGALDRNNIV